MIAGPSEPQVGTCPEAENELAQPTWAILAQGQKGDIPPHAILPEALDPENPLFQVPATSPKWRDPRNRAKGFLKGGVRKKKPEEKSMEASDRKQAEGNVR